MSERVSAVSSCDSLDVRGGRREERRGWESGRHNRRHAEACVREGWGERRGETDGVKAKVRARVVCGSLSHQTSNMKHQTMASSSRVRCRTRVAVRCEREGRGALVLQVPEEGVQWCGADNRLVERRLNGVRVGYVDVERGRVCRCLRGRCRRVGIPGAASVGDRRVHSWWGDGDGDLAGTFQRCVGAQRCTVE